MRAQQRPAPAALEDGLLFKKGDGAVILGESREPKAALVRRVSSGGVTRLKIDGCLGARVCLLRGEAMEEESTAKKQNHAIWLFCLVSVLMSADFLYLLNTCSSQSQNC